MKTTASALVATLAGGAALALLPAGAAHADDLAHCNSVQSYSKNTVVYTGTCPSGLINAVSKNYYAKSPRIKGESFGKKFNVRYHRYANRTTITGTYGRSTVNGSRTKAWLGRVRFSLTGNGTFGGTPVSCSTTGKLKGPSIDQTRWEILAVNGKYNPSSSSTAWERCAFLLLTQEAFAYTGA